MKNNSIVFSILLFFFSFAAFATPMDSIGVTKINNKLHVRYLVSPGETIYGISTKFGVSVSDLMELNPELENGLKVGQVINIPYNPEAMRPVKKDDNLITHKVQPGETFYSLSRKYNTSVDELMKMNNIQLKAGQEVVVGYKNQPNNVTANNTTSKTTSATNTTTTPVETKPVQEVKTESVNSYSATAVKTETVVNNQNNNNTASTSTNLTANNVAQTNNNTANTTATTVKTNTTNTTNTEVAPQATASSEIYPYDPTKKQVLIIPFDPYLYFSDADDEIAARSSMPRTKVRQVFRKRLNAMLDAPGYETIHLLGGKAKDSLSDLNKIYGMVGYNFQQVVMSPYNKLPDAGKPVELKNNKSWLDKQKDKIANLTSNTEGNAPKYDVPQDNGSYFGVIIKSQDFFTYFINKYSIDYFVFVSQFEVKTNYEHCLDRAAQNYDRTFTTHFSIFDNTGKQISGNKFKTHYNSNSNYVYQIVADNMEQISNRILADLPPPGGQ